MQIYCNEASSAHVAHQVSMARIYELLARLQVGVDAQLKPTTGALHWAHAGDAKSIELTLQHLCERVFREGEYT